MGLEGMHSTMENDVRYLSVDGRTVNYFGLPA